MNSACRVGLLLLLAHTVWADGVTRAVLIGISSYRNAAKLVPLKYADRDARLLATASPLRRARPVELTDAGATQPAVLETLRRVLAVDASPVDTVLIFISGRGLALADSATGTVLAHESDPERLNSGVTVEAIDRLLANTRAGHVILVLDVLRDPPEKIGQAGRNLINFLLADLPKKHARLDVVLASELRNSSREDNVGGGHGVFTHFFMEGLSGKADADGNGVLTLSELFPWVQARVTEYTKNTQTPKAVRSKRNTTVLTAGVKHPRFADQPILVASAGSVQMPTGQTADDLRARAVKLEEEGQLVLVTYGEGDQLPEDPLRLGREDFRRCADRFAEARAIRLQIAMTAGGGGAADEETAAASSLEAREMFCRGRELLYAGEPRKATAALNRSRQLDPRSPEALNALGIAAYFSAQKESEFDEAVQLLESAIARAPDWAYARHNLALAYIRQGNFERAIAEYRHAIRRTPYHGYLYYNLGALLHQLNLQDEAKVEYEHALTIFGEQAASDVGRRAEVLRLNQAAAHNALGALLQTSGRRADAESHFRAALKLNTSLVPARYNLAVLLDGKDEAAVLLQQIVSVDPSFLPARLKLAEVQRRAGRFDTALEVLHGVEDSSFVRMLTAETQGDAAFAGNRSAEACSSYKTAAENAPPDSTYRRDLERKLRERCRQNSKRSIS